MGTHDDGFTKPHVALPATGRLITWQLLTQRPGYTNLAETNISEAGLPTPAINFPKIDTEL